jgi:hypothetical protein
VAEFPPPFRVCRSCERDRSAEHSFSLGFRCRSRAAAQGHHIALGRGKHRGFEMTKLIIRVVLLAFVSSVVVTSAVAPVQARNIRYSN